MNYQQPELRMKRDAAPQVTSSESDWLGEITAFLPNQPSLCCQVLMLGPSWIRQRDGVRACDRAKPEVLAAPVPPLSSTHCSSGSAHVQQSGPVQVSPCGGFCCSSDLGRAAHLPASRLFSGLCFLLSVEPRLTFATGDLVSDLCQLLLSPHLEK